MTELVFPWPPKELSPNGRLHWSKKSKAAKAYRAACYLLTKQAGVKVDWAGDVHALLWLDVLQQMHRRGRAKFDSAGSAKQLQGAREALERFLSVGKKREAK